MSLLVANTPEYWPNTDCSVHLQMVCEPHEHRIQNLYINDKQRRMFSKLLRECSAKYSGIVSELCGTDFSFVSSLMIDGGLIFVNS